MFGIGMSELLLILVIALIILGPKRLPDIARALGKGLNEFRKAANDIKSTLDLEEEDSPAPMVESHLPAEDPYAPPKQKTKKTEKTTQDKTPLAG